MDDLRAVRHPWEYLHNFLMLFLYIDIAAFILSEMLINNYYDVYFQNGLNYSLRKWSLVTIGFAAVCIIQSIEVMLICFTPTTTPCQTLPVPTALQQTTLRILASLRCRDKSTNGEWWSRYLPASLN
jgi:hypothetical protein